MGRASYHPIQVSWSVALRVGEMRYESRSQDDCHRVVPQGHFMV